MRSINELKIRRFKYYDVCARAHITCGLHDDDKIIETKLSTTRRVIHTIFRFSRHIFILFFFFFKIYPFVPPTKRFACAIRYARDTTLRAPLTRY